MTTSALTSSHPVVLEALALMPVIDGHNDLPCELRGRAGYSVAALDRLAPDYQTDIPRLRAGGVGGQFWSAFVPTDLGENEAVVATLEQIDAIERLTAAYPGDFALVRTARAARAAIAEGKIASLIGVEGGHQIARSAAVLRQYARLGVRYLTLTHGSNTPWADSATDEPGVGGLTGEGRAVVRECQELGILVDLSHVAASTMRAALDVADEPVIFSHSSAQAVTDHPRNVPDDVLESMAAAGGVCMATFVPRFVSQAVRDWEAEAEAEFAARGIVHSFGAHWAFAPRPGESAKAVRERWTAVPGGGAGVSDFERAAAEWAVTHPAPVATVEDVADHVDHIREVAGVDHVGLGGDYDGVPAQPRGLEDVSGYPHLLEVLAGRGWTVSDLTALTGRNILRVLQAADDRAGL